MTRIGSKKILGEELAKRWGLNALELFEVMIKYALAGYDENNNNVIECNPPLDFRPLRDVPLLRFKETDVERIETDYDGFMLDEPADDELLEMAVPVINFYKKGQKWLIGKKGKEGIFDDLDGFKYVHFLLMHPEREFEAYEVYHFGSVPDELKNIPKETHQKICDEKGKRKLLNYKEELEQELEETDNLKEREKLRDKIEKINSCVNEANYSFSSGLEEKSRISVQKGIKKVLDIIYEQAEVSPSLKCVKKHLCRGKAGKTVKTGFTCWYRPNPLYPVRWHLKGE